MPNFFISYRRSDQEGQYLAHMMFRELRRRYGDESAFLDVDSRSPGLSFPAKVEQALKVTDVVLVIIGPEWLRQLSERLGDSRDWVRYEIAESLKRSGMPVVPVCRSGVEMPRPHQLPEDLKDLGWRDGVTLDPFQDFDAQMARLLSDLETVLERLRREKEDRAAEEAAAKKAAKNKRQPRRAVWLSQSVTWGRVRKRFVIVGRDFPSWLKRLFSVRVRPVSSPGKSDGPGVPQKYYRIPARFTIAGSVLILVISVPIGLGNNQGAAVLIASFISFFLLIIGTENVVCRTCVNLCKTYRGVAKLRSCDPAELKRRLEAKDLAFLEALGAPPANADQWLDLNLCYCIRCGATNTLDVKLVTRTISAKGRRSMSTTTLVRRLLVTAAECAKIVRIGQKV